MNTTGTDMVEYMHQALDERATPDSEAWKRFQDEVEECFPYFRDMVHAEGLRCEEYRICMLLKAGFRPVEIEILLGYKPKTLATYQRRLLKKIFDTDGSAKELRERVTSAGHEERIMRRYCG